VAEILRTKKWRDGYHSIMDCWASLNRLGIWMNELLDAEESGKRFRLVVWDNTSFQIPWETLYCDIRDEWVGMEVEVSRWLSINDLGRVATFTASAATCRGGVVALETQDIFGPHGPLLDAPLARLGSTAKRSMWQLLAALNNAALPLGQNGGA
jgi:hypothetical protein